MKKYLLIGFSFSYLLTMNVFAQDNEIDDSISLLMKYISISSFANNNHLNIACQGKKPFMVLNCHFTITRFWTMSEEDKKKANDELANIDKVSQKDFDKLKQTYKSFSSEEVKKRIEKSTPEQRSYINDLMTFSKSIAVSNNIPELKKSMLAFNRIQEQTCTIRQDSWDAEFTKTSAHKWTSNSGAGGLCNVTVIQVLEIKSDPELWSYTSTTISADTESKGCKFLKNEINKPITYSWDAPNTFNPSCKYIEYK